MINYIIASMGMILLYFGYLYSLRDKCPKGKWRSPRHDWYYKSIKNKIGLYGVHGYDKCRKCGCKVPVSFGGFSI
jgi:hypothetical protein